MNFVCSEVENMTISINYYEYIKQMYETLTKYIKSYKNETNDYYKKIAKVHEKYYPRLSGIKEELKKYTNIKTNHIISLSTKVPKIINQQIINLQYFISGIETTIKSFDKTLKEKNSMSAKYQNEYDDCRNSLLKKYREIEKSKNNYFSNASQTEDLIYKYYLSKNPNLVQNYAQEINSIITENQVENSIKQSKKSENEYLNLVRSAKSYEDKFFELSDTSIDNMKRISCEIITKMKDNIVDFLLLLKNCFKLPLSEIDTYLPELIKLDENKKIEHIINSTYKKDHNLVPIELEKYTIKLTNKLTNDGEEEENNYILEEEEIINTIKKMEDNFELIDKESLDKLNNQTKLRCRELTFKLLSFSPNIIKELNKNTNNNTINDKNKENENNINKDNNGNENENKNDNKKDYSITQEEIEELSKQIEDKGNRAIFFREMHSFRKNGQFEIPEREFNILCDLFDKIATLIKNENDSLSMSNIIILSQTYYKLENNNKIYIQQIIKKNKIFKEKEFWDDYVNSTILKEVQKNINKDINDPKIVDQKSMENKKYEKIIFSQIVPLLNNMIDFGLDDTIIKSIIQTIISYYKINEESSKTIYEMIKYKGIKDEPKMKKYYKDLNFSVINENNIEETETVYEKGSNKNDDNKNENKKNEEEEDNDDDKINEDMFINVNHTLADEEEEDEINKKMIKVISSDEIEDDDINAKMIKDVDDDEINEEEEENNEDNKNKEKSGDKKDEKNENDKNKENKTKNENDKKNENKEKDEEDMK